MGGTHFSSITFLLNRQEAVQSNIRLSLGPFASYDIYRNKRYAFNVYTSSQYYFYDSMEISIKEREGELKESRAYKSNLSFSQLLGLNFQFFKSFYTFDSIIGSNVRINLPKNYTADQKGFVTSFWQNTSSDDSYSQPLTAEVSLFIGLQSYY